MEISRFGKSGLAPLAESRNTDTPAPATARTARGGDSGLRVDALQAALRTLPEVDSDRVAILKQALAEGRIDTSPAGLAAGMLAYHRGSDA